MLHDPHEPGRRAEQYAKVPEDEAFLDAVNRRLSAAAIPPTENAIDPASLPLVYIVGAPRSGTTVLYQLLCRCLPLGYITNLAARFWMRPSVGIRLSRLVLPEARTGIALTSTHGTTSGPGGPHEFGYFWRMWMRLDQCRTHHLSPEELARVDSAGLKRALENEILASFGSGVVLKSVSCGFQARFLTELHPRSLFIHILRDEYECCASILRARFQRYGSYATWWSLKPSTFPFPGTEGDPAAEVVRQVRDSREAFHRALGEEGIRSLFVDYERLCAAPREVIGRIADAVSALGIPCAPLDNAPAALERGKVSALPGELDTRLRALLSNA